MPSFSERFSRLQRFLPASQGFSAREYARSALGVLIGIAFAVLLGWLGRDAEPGLPWLVAPMGATAILVFAMPTSPLAQPWPTLGGSVIPALIGIACSHWLQWPLAAAGMAVALALLAMFVLRCLHPPGGAMAMLAAFGEPGGTAYSYMFALEPVALNAIAMLMAAVLYHRLSGHRYPIGSPRPVQRTTRDPLPSERFGVTSEDLDAVLREYNEVFDISRSDLEEILHRTELHAYQRRFGKVRCADVMSRDLVKVESRADLKTAWSMLISHRLQALPVVDQDGRVTGIVTQYDFLKLAEPGETAPLAQRLRRMLWRTARKTAGKAEKVGQIMTTQVKTVPVNATIAELVPLFSDLGLHHAPVVDTSGRLVGMLTQSDLISALYKVSLGAVDPPRQAA